MFAALPPHEQFRFSGFIQTIMALIAQYGPQAKPYVDSFIAQLPISAIQKAILTALADMLLSGNVPTWTSAPIP